MSGEPKEQLPRMTAGEDPHTTTEDNTVVVKANLEGGSGSEHRSTFGNQIVRLRARKAEKKAAERQQQPGTTSQASGPQWNELTPDQRRQLMRLRGAKGKLPRI